MVACFWQFLRHRVEVNLHQCMWSLISTDLHKWYLPTTETISKCFILVGNTLLHGDEPVEVEIQDFDVIHTWHNKIVLTVVCIECTLDSKNHGADTQSNHSIFLTWMIPVIPISIFKVKKYYHLCLVSSCVWNINMSNIIFSKDFSQDKNFCHPI